MIFNTSLISSSRQTLKWKILTIRQFHIKTLTKNRIGPHDVDVISVLIGCLLGDAHAYLSNAKVAGTSFRFKQSGRHKDYLFFLYNFFYQRGYCTSSGPREYKTNLITSNGNKKTHYGYEFDVFTFSSLNWLYDLFYLERVKIVHPQLINYLTPMSLAFLIMDDGTWVAGSKSVRIATNSFTREEVELLISIFESKTPSLPIS